MRKIRRLEHQLFFTLPFETPPVKPTITFHKSGRFVIFKANDIESVDVLREVRGRMPVQPMRSTRFYGVETEKTFQEKDRIQIYQWLSSSIDMHPLVDIFKSYGLEVQISPSLRNYMIKEWRRQQMEDTPYPTPPVVTDISLFDRCCEGLMLRCIKNFRTKDSQADLFVKGERYLVLAAGENGREVVTLSTNAISSRGVISDLVGNGAKFEWTPYEEDMEKYFDDSESMDLGKDMLATYAANIHLQEKKLKAMQLPLYEHVEIDASMMSLKRGVINAYPMRMAKTSCAIAVAELSESQKIGIVSPNNARLFWTKEFKRLGFKPEYSTEVRRFADLEKPSKYHLLTYNWLRYSVDDYYSSRGWNTILKPSSRKVRVKNEAGIMVDQDNELFNKCPHCGQDMWRYRPELVKDFRWTRVRGYMCKNEACTWTTDNHYARNGKKKLGAAWFQPEPGKPIEHEGGYIDTDIAMHAKNCPDERVSGRQCKSCGVADGTWQPPRYRRLTKRFTHVVLDEGHACKDHTSDTARAGLSFRARRRQVLTGTPISNSPMDIYWPLHWAVNAPSPAFPYFRTEGFREFDQRFCDQIYLERNAGVEVDDQGNEIPITKTVRKRVPFLKNPPDFWRFVAGKMRRRTYQDPLFQKTLIDAGRSMPEVDVKRVFVPMVQAQRDMYLASLKDFKSAFETMKAEAEKENQSLNMAKIQNMSQMVTMRTIATCPEFLNEKFKSEVYSGPAGGGKMRIIEHQTRKEVADGGKVLILSDFISMQKSCEAALKDLNVVRFNTAWDDDQRKAAFDKFQDDDKVKVFIAGTRAVREGVDLSRADTCICTDLLWSPAFQVQAWSRIMAPATRERLCKVFLMLSQHTIDAHIYNVFYSKMKAAEQALDRRVLNRRAQEVDVKWFVDRILEAEQFLSAFEYRDADPDDIIEQKLDVGFYEQREG